MSVELRKNGLQLAGTPLWRLQRPRDFSLLDRSLGEVQELLAG